jgi:hypothetical protein
MRASFNTCGDDGCGGKPPGRSVDAKVEATYLVECFWPGVTREAVEAANGRACHQAEVLRREGSSLRFLGSLLVPSDEVVFFQFVATTSAEVARAAREAQLPFDRVAASLWVEPGGEGVPLGEPLPVKDSMQERRPIDKKKGTPGECT